MSSNSGRIGPILVLVTLLAFSGAGVSQGARTDVTVTITSSSGGSVTATGGTPCRSTCSVSVPLGSDLVLNASADGGNHFDAWGGSCSGTNPVCEVSVDGATGISAGFAPGELRLPVASRLAVTRSGPGHVTSDPTGLIDCALLCSAGFSGGGSLTLNAIPDAGAAFVGWGGDCAGTGSCPVTLTADREVRAVFRSQISAGTSTFALVNREPPPQPGIGSSGTGAVQVAVPGQATTTCEVAQCAYTVPNGTAVTLDALGTLDAWISGCVGTAFRCVIVITAPTTITVTFKNPEALTNAYGLQVSHSQGGSISSTPSAIACGNGSTCTAAFNEHTRVQLVAHPDPGYQFVHWSGNCSGSTCMVTMDAAQYVGALFRRVQQLVTVRATGRGTGTVTSDPPGISCGSSCSHAYPEGTALKLTAAADPRSHFAGWSGGPCSGNSPCNATVNADTSITATFDRCAAAYFANFGVSAGTRPRRIIVRVPLEGGARVSVGVFRRSTLVASNAREVAVGTSTFQLPLRKSRTKTTLRVQVRVADACGASRTLSRQIRG